MPSGTIRNAEDAVPAENSNATRKRDIGKKKKGKRKGPEKPVRHEPEGVTAPRDLWRGAHLQTRHHGPTLKKRSSLTLQLAKSGRSPAVGTAWCRFSGPLNPKKPQQFDDRPGRTKLLRPRPPGICGVLREAHTTNRGGKHFWGFVDCESWMRV